MSDRAVISVTGDVSNVHITGGGSLDFTNTEGFKRRLEEAAGAADTVIVDLRTATLVDGTVLESIATAAKTMSRRGKRLKVIVKEDTHPCCVLLTVGLQQILCLAIRADRREGVIVSYN